MENENKYVLKRKRNKIGLDELYTDAKDLEDAIISGDDYFIDIAFQKLLIDISAYFGYEAL